jgi:uncharacterized protein YdbL (DUF1318 family)
MRFSASIALMLGVLASVALGQSSQLASAIAAGQVGERYDGYMGFASQPSDALRREVIAINIKRRSLYTQVATQRGVTVSLVALTTACTLLRGLGAGEAYMLSDKIWRRRAPGAPPPQPDECRQN